MLVYLFPFEEMKKNYMKRYTEFSKFPKNMENPEIIKKVLRGNTKKCGLQLWMEKLFFNK